MVPLQYIIYLYRKFGSTLSTTTTTTITIKRYLLGILFFSALTSKIDYRQISIKSNNRFLEEHTE